MRIRRLKDGGKSASRTRVHDLGRDMQLQDRIVLHFRLCGAVDIEASWWVRDSPRDLWNYGGGADFYLTREEWRELKKL